MELLTFSLIASAMGLGYLFVGYKTSKTIGSTTDFFLAGKNVGIFGLTMSLIATQIGGGAILGTSQEAYSYGLLAFAYITGIAIGFILLASSFAHRIRAQNVHTIAQIFEKRYGSPFLTKVASIASITSLGGILVAQIVGSRALLLSMNLYTPILFISLWAVVITYTMMGGLKAVISNNAFQLLVILIVFIILFFIDLIISPNIPASIPTAFQLSKQLPDAVIRFLTIAITPTLYCLFEQDIAQTIIAAKNQKTVFWGTTLAAASMVTFAYLPFYFGIQARNTPLLEAAISSGAQPLMSLIAHKYSILVQLLVLYGILAAILSTANSLLCAISAHVTEDFHLNNIYSHSRANLIIPKLVTLFIGSIAFILAQSSENILNIIILSYQIPIATIFVPIMGAYLLKKVSSAAAYVCVITGLIGYLGTIMNILPFWGIWGSIGLSTLLFIIINPLQTTQYSHEIN